MTIILTSILVGIGVAFGLLAFLGVLWAIAELAHLIVGTE